MRVIDQLYALERRLSAPICGAKSDLTSGCMSNVSIAKALGFDSYRVGNLEKIQPARFSSVEEVEAYPWRDRLRPQYLEEELRNYQNLWQTADRLLVGGGAFGPLTVASDILGIDHCLRLGAKQPEVLRAVLEHTTQYILTLAQAEDKIGQGLFWVAEPLASLFAPSRFEELCGQYIRRIVQGIDAPLYLHVCGKTTAHTRQLMATGAQVLSIDWTTDLAACLAMAPEEVVIMGNVNPMLFLDGTREQIEAAVRTAMEQGRHYKNFILSTGCMIPWGSPEENGNLMVELCAAEPHWSSREFRLIRRLERLALAGDRTSFDALASAEACPPALTEAALWVARQANAHAAAPSPAVL